MRYRKFWMEMGSIIRQHRRRAGRTQRGMALDLAIPRPSYSLIEAGGRTIDAAELVRICHILNLSVQLLLHEAVKADPSPTHPWYTIEQQELEGGNG